MSDSDEDVEVMDASQLKEALLKRKAADAAGMVATVNEKDNER